LAFLHPFPGDVERLGSRVDRRQRVGGTGQRLGPQAGPAGDLQDPPARPEVLHQPGDAHAGRVDVAVGGGVVLTGPAPVVVDLVAQDLLGHQWLNPATRLIVSAMITVPKT
jgi:hypothetical protein